MPTAARSLAQLTLAALIAIPAAHAAPVDLVHQGRLLDAAGAPVSGTRALTFRLWSAESGGTQLGPDHHVAGVPLTDGYFAVTLAGVDTAHLVDALWIGVSIDAGAELAPRQRLVPAPQAATLAAGARAAGELVLASISGPTCADDGALAYEPTTRQVRFCADGRWQSLASASGDGSADNPAISCRRLHADFPDLPSGPYWVDADRSGDAVQVHCDMVTDDGGWTVVGRASDTNGVGNDYEFRAAVGEHSVMGLTFDHGSTTDAQHLRGLSRLLEPGRATVEVQYYCYDSRNVAGTSFWVTAGPFPTSQLVTGLTPTNPDFLVSPVALRSKAGDTTSTGNFGLFARGQTGTATCGNTYAGQSGMKFTCATTGQQVLNPQGIWYLTHFATTTAYTEVNSCGPVGGSVLPYYRGEVRIR